jgi:hypothetical protein
VILKSSEANDETTRARVLALAFDGDEARMQRFIDELAAVAHDKQVILRGSAVTGSRWADGQPFDADGPGTSDLDITFLSSDVLGMFESHYIPGLHSVPLNDSNPDACPPLIELRQRLCRIAHRPVNIQASRSLVQFVRDVLWDQPYYTLIGKSDDEEDDEESEKDAS